MQQEVFSFHQVRLTKILGKKIKRKYKMVPKTSIINGELSPL